MSKQPKQHGGSRLNSGRKTEDPTEKVEKMTITIYPMTRRKLAVLGDGNVSKGIRKAADLAFAKYQDA